MARQRHGRRISEPRRWRSGRSRRHRRPDDGRGGQQVAGESSGGFRHAHPGHAERRGGGGPERWNKAILVRIVPVALDTEAPTASALKPGSIERRTARSGRLQPSLSGATITSRPAGYGCPARRWIPGRRCTRTESAHRSSFFDVNACPDGSAAAMRYLFASGGFAQGYPPRRPIGSSSSRGVRRQRVERADGDGHLDIGGRDGCSRAAPRP